MTTSERLAPLSSVPYSVTVDMQTRADRMVRALCHVRYTYLLCNHFVELMSIFTFDADL